MEHTPPISNQGVVRTDLQRDKERGEGCWRAKNLKEIQSY